MSNNPFYLDVVPRTLQDLKVNDYIQLQITSNAIDVRVTVADETIVTYDKIHKELHAIAEGKTYITFEALNNAGDIVKSLNVSLAVSNAEKSREMKLMFHNRGSNRLNTLVYDGKEDMMYKLPSRDGKLLTKETLLGNEFKIEKPKIISPKNGDTEVEGEMEASEYKPLGSYNGVVEGSYWEFATDKEFREIIETRSITTEPINKCPIIHHMLNVYVRMCYISGIHKSSYSNVVYYTGKVTSRDNLKTLLNGDARMGYYGIVPHSELIDNRDYIGNFDTLLANNLKAFKAGQQVHRRNDEGKDILYYALKDIPDSTNIKPGEAIAIDSWKVDDRNNLPTPKWVNDVTGVAMGRTDNNVDTYSSGAKNIGPMVDHELGWIKYIYNGKICYTPVKPICTQVCWNDIAKRYIAYGEKTFRAGEQMYRIRLMKEDEYIKLMSGLMDGTLANFTQSDIGLVDANDPTIARVTWLEDFEEGSKRKLGDHTGKNILTADPKMRLNGVTISEGVTAYHMSYRPVMEIVTSADEKWKNLPPSIRAENENFIYDKFTDTGYFGVIKATDFILGNEALDKAGLNYAIPYNEYTDWMKFYWHGIILYVPKNPLIKNYKFQMSVEAGCVHPFDTGDNKAVSFKIQDIKFRFHHLTTGKYATVLRDDYTKYNLTQYSQHHELIPRIVKDFNKYTAANEKVGGPQIGDDWENFEYNDLVPQPKYMEGADLINFNNDDTRVIAMWSNHNQPNIPVSFTWIYVTEQHDQYSPSVSLKLDHNCIRFKHQDDLKLKIM